MKPLTLGAGQLWVHMFTQLHQIAFITARIILHLISLPQFIYDYFIYIILNEHIVSTVSSCMSRLGQINRVKHIFNKHALIIIINALVFSKLFYCSSVWSNTTQTNLDKLQAVQNFACRILSGAKKFDHITPLLKDLRWLPIRQQLYFRFAVLVFKCMTSCAPEYLTSKLVGRSAVSTRNTRNSQLLNIPLFRTASGQRTFQYRATSLWNELQPALKLSSSVTEFKRLLRQKLLNDCFI